MHQCSVSMLSCFLLASQEVHQKEDGFRISLLSISPAHTSILVLLLAGVRQNMLYLLVGALRGYAVRLLLELCTRVPISVCLKLA